MLTLRLIYDIYKKKKDCNSCCSRSLDRKLAFTSMLGSDWHTRKQNVYNWPSNKSDLRSLHDRLASSRPSQAIRKSIGINSGPRITTMARPPWYTSDWPVILCDRLATWARPPRVTCLTRQKFAWDENFKSDLRPIYDRAEWHTRPPSDLRPTCEDLRPKEDPAASWVTRKWNGQVSRPFLTVKRGRGVCRLQWRVSPSHCEYSGVTYDLLVCSIRGTYDLADQLPSSNEFCHYLVVSQSQVPREFGVNLA